jgi:hypothetical protein
MELTNAFNYGWYTSLDAAASTLFGHIDMTGTSSAKPVVFGASRPQPQRSIHKLSRATSFIAVAKKEDAAFQPVKKEKACPKPSPGNAKSKRVYVTYEGVNYAWNQPTEVIDKSGGMSALGVKDVESSTQCAIGVNTVWNQGVFHGKPPRARKIVDSSGDVDTVSSFYGVATLPEGWT